MPHRVTLSAEASRNIEAIYHWIAERSAEGAARWYLALQDRLATLNLHPERYPLAPESKHFEREIRNANFRTRVGRTYRLLFTIHDDELIVLFIRGPGQDWVSP